MGLRRVARWRVDDDALERACTVLGVRRPVTVLATSQRHTSGRYLGMRGGRHRITLRARLTVVEASRTLWHELTHALQRERYSCDFLYFCDYSRELSRPRSLGRAHTVDPLYDLSPFEVEAEANVRLHEEMPLTVRRGR